MNSRTIDLNADVGEGCGFDEELVPLVSSVNIACGAHAGDRGTMRRAAALALGRGVAIGAHPGFADRDSFGRAEMPIRPEAAAALVMAQVRLLDEVAAELGARPGHVKLHGALYNMSARDPVLAAAVAEALAADGRSGRPRALVVLAGSAMAEIGRRAGLVIIREAFADRAYRPDASLAPRAQAGAVIEDIGAAAEQAARIASGQEISAIDGTRLRVEADTICIHGDRASSPRLAGAIRAALAELGIGVAAPSAQGGANRAGRGLS